MKTKIVIGLFITAFMASCQHAGVIPADPAISYSKQVQPVLVANCTMSGCHDGIGGSGREGAFSLLNYSDLTQRNMVVAGNAGGSRLYTAITGSGENSMPPNGALSNDDVLLIYLWIQQGAKNN